MNINRAGHFVSQPSGYASFVPNKLPPEPGINYDAELINLLSIADRNLGRLDGITETLPNPNLFMTMYVVKEALLSSQIEGTQASLSDVLAKSGITEKKEDVTEVINYVSAMDHGLSRLNTFPLSLRLLREIHGILLKSGRGSGRNPGEFRTSQNWIGPSGSTLQTASFVPPTVPDMEIALGDLENYLYEEDGLPPLIKIALIHAQFETIHPFLDGNGRMGRLLITFWLCQQKILRQPLLYISYYFKKHRTDYYDHLMDVRKNGDWEGWIKFFLKGIAEVSEEATITAKEILDLKNDIEKQLGDTNSTNALALVDLLFEKPIITKQEVEERLKIAQPTAGRLVERFCELGILVDNTPTKKRYKEYKFSKYLELLNRGMELNGKD